MYVKGYNVQSVAKNKKIKFISVIFSFFFFLLQKHLKNLHCSQFYMPLSRELVSAGERYRCFVILYGHCLHIPAAYRICSNWSYIASSSVRAQHKITEQLQLVTTDFHVCSSLKQSAIKNKPKQAIILPFFFVACFFFS